MESDLRPHSRQAGGEASFERTARTSDSRAASGVLGSRAASNDYRDLSRQQLGQSRDEPSTSGLAPADSMDSASASQRSSSIAKGRAQDDSGLGRRSQGSAPIKAIQVPGGAHSEPPSLVPSLSTSPGAPTEDWLDSKERFMAVMQNFLPKVGNIAAPGPATASALFNPADLMKGVQEMTLAAPQDLRLPGMTMDPPSSTGLHSWPLQQRPEPQPVAPRTSSLNTTSDAPRVPASWAGYRMPVSTPPMDPSMMLLAGMAAPGMGATSVDPMDPNAHLRGLLLSQGSAQLSGRMTSTPGPVSIEPPGLAPSTSAQLPGSAEGGSAEPSLLYRPPVGAEDELQSLLQEQKEPSGPSRFLWVGNLLTRVNRAILKVVFEPYGPLDDVITFMGRMYAFVSFHRTEDAVNAVLALQNRPLPSLTGDKPLLVNFRSKRVEPRPGDASDEASGAAALPASPHPRKSLEEGMDRPAQRSEALENASTRIWCGNIASHVTSRTLKSVFASYGYLLTDVAVFPARIGPLGYAFINFATLEEAVRAYMQLQNLVIGALTGNKQLKMRFKPIAGSAGFAHADSEVNAAPLPDVADAGSLPSANLSNRLNPNNVHFDRDMASHYKALSKSDKEVLWARDRLANVGQPPQGLAQLAAAQQRLPFAGALSYPGGRQYLPGTRFDPNQMAASRQYAAMQQAVRSSQSLPPPGSGLLPDDVHLMRALQESALQGGFDPRLNPQQMTGMEPQGQYMGGHNPALLAQLAQMGRLPPVSPLADPGSAPNMSWPPPQPGQGYGLSPYPSQLPSHGSGGLHGQGSGLQGHASGGLQHPGMAAPSLNDPALQGLLPPGAGQAPPPNPWLGYPGQWPPSG